MSSEFNLYTGENEGIALIQEGMQVTLAIVKDGKVAPLNLDFEQMKSLKEGVTRIIGELKAERKAMSEAKPE